jgi:hypothetical protein
MADQLYKTWTHIVPLDIDNLRITIPSTVDYKVKASDMWKIVKDMMGSDLTKFSLPVFINEPTSALMKAADMGYYLADEIPKISRMQNSLERLLHLTAHTMGVLNQIPGRVSKPFNPLLGETYELVTP